MAEPTSGAGPVPQPPAWPDLNSDGSEDGTVEGAAASIRSDAFSVWGQGVVDNVNVNTQGAFTIGTPQ